MCSPATCRKCSKTTWAGCGQHVDQVMRHVPKAQQCDCHETERTSAGSNVFSRLFSR